MNRRFFLRAAFASTATIVVAPAAVLDELHDDLRTRRTYVDMGKNAKSPLPEWVREAIREVRPLINTKSATMWLWRTR